MAGNASHMVCPQYSGCCHHGGCVVTGTQKSFPKLWGGSDRLPIPKGGFWNIEKSSYSASLHVATMLKPKGPHRSPNKHFYPMAKKYYIESPEKHRKDHK